MVSLITGYSYDIFISYRQKDNKYDSWVTEFVDHLKAELESTFKEEISVYFDINPYDGLLETHDVDESLKEKLKCLIFIPIISRTYCDPKSFAWEHEFKAFVEIASRDQFGLKLRLPNGNVTSRVLPVRIHDLDPEDIKQCESVLGGFLRGIDFIYKEPGVNRPLSPKDDESKNLNNVYRNQLNKVANVIKEIISGISGEPKTFRIEHEKVIAVVEKPPVQEKSIIVLPFENISPDPDQEYFSDGLTEEIITDLSHIRDLLVISRNSAMTFKGTKKKTKDIANEVNVRYVLEGSVRKAANNLRITAQLIDALTDTHIWAEKFGGTLGDIFDIQEKVSQSIVEALRLRLSPEEKTRLISQQTKSIKAYDLRLKSWYYHNQFTLNSIKQAIEYAKQAIIEDPRYATAYTDLAMCYIALGNIGHAPPKEMYPLAKKYATTALGLDENLAEAHMILEWYYQDFEWNWTMAENEFKQANQLKPNDSFTHMTYSWLLAFTSRHEESIIQMKKALEYDPLYVLPASCIGEVYMLARKSDLAIEQCLRVIAREPEFWMTYWFLGVAYLQKGENDKAVEAFTKGAIVGDRDSVIIALLGHSLGTIGRKDEAREILDELMARRKESYVSPYWLAMVLIGLKEYDIALDWLQEGYEERAGYMWAIHIYVQFDPLRDNPVFQELCRKMNLR